MSFAFKAWSHSRDLQGLPQDLVESIKRDEAKSHRESLAPRSFQGGLHSYAKGERTALEEGFVDDPKWAPVEKTLDAAMKKAGKAFMSMGYQLKTPHTGWVGLRLTPDDGFNMSSYFHGKSMSVEISTASSDDSLAHNKALYKALKKMVPVMNRFGKASVWGPITPNLRIMLQTPQEAAKFAKMFPTLMARVAKQMQAVKNESVAGAPGAFAVSDDDVEYEDQAQEWTPWEPPKASSHLDEFRRLAGRVRSATSGLPSPVNEGIRAPNIGVKKGILDP